METQTAIQAFSALAHEQRLSLFRLLVKAVPDALPAGEIARRLSLPASTLSGHLSALQQAGLIRAERQSRSILYSIDQQGTAGLIRFLMEDCCAGRPDICGVDLKEMACA